MSVYTETPVYGKELAISVTLRFIPAREITILFFKYYFLLN